MDIVTCHSMTINVETKKINNDYVEFNYHKPWLWASMHHTRDLKPKQVNKIHFLFLTAAA